MNLMVPDIMDYSGNLSSSIILLFFAFMNVLAMERLPALTGDTDCSSRLPVNNATRDLQVAIRDRINPLLNSRYGPPCGCGGPQWTKIVDLDMSQTSQTCPTNWTLVTEEIRGCVSPSSGCHSAIFPVTRMYSEVCGRIEGIQFGAPEAFDFHVDRNYNLEQRYLDGVSLTHGTSGSRKHIWSFAMTRSESETLPRVICPCTDPSMDWPYTLAPYIGNNYFCDTGARASAIGRYYTEDPLWDGQGCGSTSTCCQQHNPPWFCTGLPNITNDDLEIRICLSSSTTNENIAITRADIYVK